METCASACFLAQAVGYSPSWEQLSQERGPWGWDPLGCHLRAGYLPWTVKATGEVMLDVSLTS